MSTLANLYNDLKTLCSQWFYTKSEIDANKQDKLVSGTNIKTINNNSLLGSGNISISGGGSNNIWDLEQSNSNTGMVAFEDYQDDDHYGVLQGLIYSMNDDMTFYKDYTSADFEIATKGDIPSLPTVQTETITVTSATTGNNYFSGGTREITAKRYGKVVMVYVNFYGVNAKQSSTATDTEIGVLPSGWRPATTVHTRVGQTGNSNLDRAEIGITTAGVINVRLGYSTALTNIGLRTTITFIAE